MLRLLAL